MLKILFSLLSAFEPVRDFVGLRQHPLTEYVTPEEKVAALLKLADGDPKPYDAILKKIKARGEHCKRQSDHCAKQVAEVEEVIRMKRAELRPDPLSIKIWERSRDSCKTFAWGYMRTHKAKLKEEASLEACRRFIEAMRAAAAKLEKKR